VTDAELIRRLDMTLARNSGVIEMNARAFERFVRAFKRFERGQTKLEQTVARLDASIDDLRDEVKASTRATLLLIDRLGPA
jgi:hypothetical protein